MPLAPSKWYNQDSGSFLSSHPAVEKIIRLVISVKTHDLTKGNISHQLLSYLLPLILSNYLTLTYNAVDSAIVGRYIGDLTLAAVGTSNPLMTFSLLFINGICLGASILIGKAYGAKDKEALRRQIVSGLAAGALVSLALSAVLIMFARPILLLLQVPVAILTEAALYVRIIMVGLFFHFCYGYFSTVLRAMGDSQTTLFILAVSAGLNVLGDYLFVVVFGWGIVGAAASTVLCELLSSLFCLPFLASFMGKLAIKQHLAVEWTIVKKIFSFSMVSALQQSSLQIGKLGTQAIVNTLGTTVIAAYSVSSRFEDYAMVPLSTIAYAMTTFIAQNIGAGTSARVRRSIFASLSFSLIYVLAFAGVMYGASGRILGLFTQELAIIRLGEAYLLTMSWIYLLCALTNVMQGFFRGMGELSTTLYSSVVNISVRVASCAILAFYFSVGFLSVAYAMLIGWIAMTCYELPKMISFLRGKEKGKT